MNVNDSRLVFPVPTQEVLYELTLFDESALDGCQRRIGRLGFQTAKPLLRLSVGHLPILLSRFAGVR